MNKAFLHLHGPPRNCLRNVLSRLDPFHFGSRYTWKSLVIGGSHNWLTCRPRKIFAENSYRGLSRFDIAPEGKKHYYGPLRPPLSSLNALYIPRLIFSPVCWVKRRFHNLSPLLILFRGCYNLVDSPFIMETWILKLTRSWEAKKSHP